MPLKSKAQLRKWGELVKQGKMSQKTFDEALKATPNVKNLPEKVGPTGTDRIRMAQKVKIK